MLSSKKRSPIPAARRRRRITPTGRRLKDALAIAEEQGLLDGARSLTLRGRMPILLVAKAKRISGIRSDSKLIEAALANMIAADDYADWLLAQRGTVNGDLDLEF